MTDRPTEAAERLRQHESGGISPRYKGLSVAETVATDRYTLANWALPLLDTTPVDEAWLRSIGFSTQPGHPDYVLWHGDIETRRIYIDEREDRMWSYHTGRNEVLLIGGLHPKTRGAVRLLLAALEGGK